MSYLIIYHDSTREWLEPLLGFEKKDSTTYGAVKPTRQKPNRIKLETQPLDNLEASKRLTQSCCGPVICQSGHMVNGTCRRAWIN